MRRVENEYYRFSENGHEVEIFRTVGALTWTLTIDESFIDDRFVTVGEIHKALDGRLGRTRQVLSMEQESYA
jgi:hypothetical protein